MPFSRYIAPVEERICEESVNSRRNIYMEFISNEDNGINDSISPRKSKSDKENRHEVRYKSKVQSDSDVVRKVDELFK
jgi:hypothetical protein